jgi:hypothetical protein
MSATFALVGSRNAAGVSLNAIRGVDRGKTALAMVGPAKTAVCAKVAVTAPDPV